MIEKFWKSLKLEGRVSIWEIDYMKDSFKLLKKERCEFSSKINWFNEFLANWTWNQKDTQAEGSRIPNFFLILQNLSSLKALVKMSANYFSVHT